MVVAIEGRERKLEREERWWWWSPRIPWVILPFKVKFKILEDFRRENFLECVLVWVFVYDVSFSPK